MDTCSIEGCDKPIRARGWCIKHWKRWYRHGDPMTVMAQQRATCEVPGCNNPAHGHGYCIAHYHKWRRHGDPLWERPTEIGQCTVEGCDKDCRSVTSPYCETHYYRLYRNGTLEVQVDLSVHDNCLHCGKKLEPEQPKFCSSRCSARYYRGVEAIRQCDHCGKEYEPYNGALTCSPECEYQRDRRQQRDYYAHRMATDPEYRARMFGAYHARRMVIEGIGSEVVVYEEVFERDGWICQLCGDPIDREAEWPDPYSPSLDHVVPLARGGAHTYDNVQCTHLRCNLSKGDRA